MANYERGDICVPSRVSVPNRRRLKHLPPRRGSGYIVSWSLPHFSGVHRAHHTVLGTGLAAVAGGYVKRSLQRAHWLTVREGYNVSTGTQCALGGLVVRGVDVGAPCLER